MKNHGQKEAQGSGHVLCKITGLGSIITVMERTVSSPPPNAAEAAHTKLVSASEVSSSPASRRNVPHKFGMNASPVSYKRYLRLVRMILAPSTHEVLL